MLSHELHITVAVCCRFTREAVCWAVELQNVAFRLQLSLPVEGRHSTQFPGMSLGFTLWIVLRAVFEVNIRVTMVATDPARTL